jgi:hypothetical protein
VGAVRSLIIAGEVDEEKKGGDDEHPPVTTHSIFFWGGGEGGFAGLVQLRFLGAFHPRILLGPPVGYSSTIDDLILGVLGRGFEPRATLQQPGALSTRLCHTPNGPCPTPVDHAPPLWTMPHPFGSYLSSLYSLLTRYRLRA